MTSIHDFLMSPEIGRVSSSKVPLNVQEETRFEGLAEEAVMIDVHQHPFVLPEAMDRFIDFLRTNRYHGGFEAVKHGGWSTVTTSNVFGALQNATEMSFVEYDDVALEVGMMLADVTAQPDVVRVGNAEEIMAAKQSGNIGFLPTLEHLPIGNRLERVDQLHAMGVRLSGITYNRKNYIGDGMYERNPGGLSEFGIEVIHRMNDIGMAIDLSHASTPTVMDTIEFSKTPVVFSHNAAYTLRPNRRTRKDEELKACADKGGLVCITAVPNALSDDPEQDIECVLDHYDYMVNLVGVDHVGVGTDTVIGDHMMFQHYMLGRDLSEMPAPYLNGLESPADGTNIIRGLIRRGHSDEDIKKIVGGNALDFFRRVLS
jgi:membrane dipeptidase